MIPQMQPVESSNIAAVGHDGKDLHVRFKSGGLYRYADVPASVHQQMLAAPSKTNFLRATVIGKHTHTKVE